VGVDGAATDNSQYEAYDAALGDNASLATATIMLGSTDVVRVYASSANVSFTCTGLEQDD
jgi:hypothetical protein